MIDKSHVILVLIRKWPLCPLSSLREKFNPWNINHIPAIAGQLCCLSQGTATLSVKFFVRLPSSPGGYAETRDLEQIYLFLDGHDLIFLEPFKAWG
jgi:hypothetical protein